MSIHIESTHFCSNGRAPRWSWWIRGVHGTNRYGVLGTDEEGEGLYLLIHRGNRPPEHLPLLGAEQFSLANNNCRAEANRKIRKALHALGWHPKD